MAKVYDVPAGALLERLAGDLKAEGIPKPAWVPFVKTGAHAKRQPHDREWWYLRCASVLRKIYMRGPVGINDLARTYGGGKPSGYGAAHHKSAGGAIIRNAVKELEKLGYVEKTRRGRMISSKGMQKLDKMATAILGEMCAQRPELKVYA